VRSETALPDGGLEWLVDLPEEQVRELAARPGVEVFDPPLEPRAQTCASGEGYLQSVLNLRA
ncbi:MAG: hypothetical protein ACKO9D_02865, partial [Gammaproteobacteria bacterium]